MVVHRYSRYSPVILTVVDALSLKVHSSIAMDSKCRASWSHLTWSPHHNCSQLLCSVDAGLKAWDVRTNK